MILKLDSSFIWIIGSSTMIFNYIKGGQNPEIEFYTFSTVIPKRIKISKKLNNSMKEN